LHVLVCYFCIFQVTLYICVKFGKAFCFVYPLLDIKWSYLYTANRYNVVNLLSFNKRNHTMLLQNCNGPNFFPAILILFYFFLTSMYGSWHTCVYECRLWDPCGNMLRSDGLYVYFHRKGLCFCLINVICVRLRIMVHMFVLCICLFVFVYYVAGFSGLSILIFPLVFSNVYYLYIRSTTGKSLTLEICCILNYAPLYKR
jgi:hypothetical protein